MPSNWKVGFGEFSYLPKYQKSLNSPNRDSCDDCLEKTPLLRSRDQSNKSRECCLKLVYKYFIFFLNIRNQFQSWYIDFRDEISSWNKTFEVGI